MDVDPARFPARGDQRLAHPRSRAGRGVQRRRSSSTTRRTSSDAWAAAERPSSRAPRKFIRSGRCASTSCSTTMCRRRFRRSPPRTFCIGLISNSHRCLESFQEHFELDGLIDVAVSSSQHGYMKPHPSIFEAALKLAGVAAADAVMVGDSLTQDIDGARGVGMRGVLVRRSEQIESTLDIRRAGDPKPDQSCPRLSRLLLAPSSCSALTRRPGERSSGEQMQMDVEDALAGFAVGVEDRAVIRARRSRAVFARSAARRNIEPTSASCSRCEIVQRRDVRLRNDEHVQRRLRVDVRNGDQFRIVIERLHRNDRQRRSCRTDSRVHVPCAALSADDRARNVLQIVADLHDVESVHAAHEIGHAIILAAAELHDEPPARRKLRGRALEHAAQSIEPVLAAEQRHRRLVIAHFRRQPALRHRRHVRGIRDDEIDALLDAVEKARFDERDAVVHVVAHGVAPRDFERVLRHVAWR